MTEKDEAMEHLTSQHEADMVALHRQYEEDLAAMQSRFDAMHFLCKTLAKEVKKRDEKIELLKGSVSAAATACQISCHLDQEAQDQVHHGRALCGLQAH